MIRRSAGADKRIRWRTVISDPSGGTEPILGNADHRSSKSLGRRVADAKREGERHRAVSAQAQHAAFSLVGFGRWPTSLRLSGLDRVNFDPHASTTSPYGERLSSTTALSRRIRSARNGRVLFYLALVPVLGLVLAFSACGSSSSNSSDTPSSSAMTRAKGSNTKADCSSQAILSALPGGATMQEFTCAKVGDTEWAAARVSPGDTVFFLAVERHQMERRGLPEHLRHRIGGPAPVAAVLL